MKQLQIIVISCLIFLTACSSRYDSKYNKETFGVDNAPNTYIVQKGDSLFAIAWRFGLDQKAIQRRNNISNPNKIFVGQRLKLNSSTPQRRPSSVATQASETTISTSNNNTLKKAPAARPANIPPSSDGSWVWPMKGKIARGFNPKRIGANGIRIAGRPNQTINAAQAGIVAYKGNGLNGYGNVVIIKHKNGLLSAYGFLSKTYVKEGQRVKKRQKIGTVGYASNRSLMLHFEVRKRGKPVNPKSYIGNRYRF